FLDDGHISFEPLLQPGKLWPVGVEADAEQADFQRTHGTSHHLTGPANLQCVDPGRFGNPSRCGLRVSGHEQVPCLRSSNPSPASVYPCRADWLVQHLLAAQLRGATE